MMNEKKFKSGFVFHLLAISIGVLRKVSRIVVWPNSNVLGYYLARSKANKNTSLLPRCKSAIKFLNKNHHVGLLGFENKIVVILL